MPKTSYAEHPNRSEHSTFSTVLKASGDVPIVRVVGQLDLATLSGLTQALGEAMSGIEGFERASRIVADLRGLTFIEVCGLRVLVRHIHLLRRFGGDLPLVLSAVEGGDSPVLRLLRLAGLTESFRLYTEPGAAARGVRPLASLWKTPCRCLPDIGLF